MGVEICEKRHRPWIAGCPPEAIRRAQVGQILQIRSEIPHDSPIADAYLVLQALPFSLLIKVVEAGVRSYGMRVLWRCLSSVACDGRTTVDGLHDLPINNELGVEFCLCGSVIREWAKGHHKGRIPTSWLAVGAEHDETLGEAWRRHASDELAD